jgi:hypothetical protein
LRELVAPPSGLRDNMRRVIDPIVLQQVRTILDSQPEWLEVRTRLVALTPEGREEAYRPLIFAFGYVLLEQSREERRVQAGGPFGAATSDRNWQFPPPLAKVEDRDIAVWQEAAGLLRDPVSAARLHDLLWERRVQPRRDQHARDAADAYLRLVEVPHWHYVNRSRCLRGCLKTSAGRAWERRGESSRVDITLGEVPGDGVDVEGPRRAVGGRGTASARPCA